MNNPQSGAEQILAERERQVNKLGWSAKSDDSCTKGELYRFAMYHLSRPENTVQRMSIAGGIVADNPVLFDHAGAFKYELLTPIQRLVRGGAMIAAEIDRLQRLENSKNE